MKALVSSSRPKTEGFRYDVTIEPTNSDTKGSVVLTMNDTVAATVAYSECRADARLTFVDGRGQ